MTTMEMNKQEKGTTTTIEIDGWQIRSLLIALREDDDHGVEAVGVEVGVEVGEVGWGVRMKLGELTDVWSIIKGKGKQPGRQQVSNLTLRT